MTIILLKTLIPRLSITSSKQKEKTRKEKKKEKSNKAEGIIEASLLQDNVKIRLWFSLTVPCVVGPSEGLKGAAWGTCNISAC